MAEQRTNGVQNCEVSLICFTLFDPNGKTYNYYSGMVDLPADINGGWSYVLDNSSPQFNDPITYDPHSCTFAVGYSINESLYKADGAYKTFMLPFYTDACDLLPKIEMKVSVTIKVVNDNGGVTKIIVKQGTVSTVKVVHGNEGGPTTPSLDLIDYLAVGSPNGNSCWNTVIRSITQPDQYFVVLWACIAESVGVVWPLMHKPNAAINDVGASNGTQIVCNWWRWGDSPAIGRNIPPPVPTPPYTAIIGSIGALYRQYTTAGIEEYGQGPDFKEYYTHALRM